MPSLNEMLAAECRLLSQFIDLLTEEEQALVAAKTDVLAAITPRKTDLVSRLNETAGRRNQVMKALGFAADTEGLKAWRQSGADADRQGGELIALASRARSQNELNGRLIAMHLRSTQAALKALTGGDANRQTYGRDGQTEMARTGYRLIDSV